MKFKNLLSLTSLMVLGFAIAVIPLFAGVIYAAYDLRETSELARTINSQVFEQTKTIRLVLQKASDIERKARLFVLLSDPALRQPYERESYESTRASFKQSLNDLLKLPIDNKIALLVNELSEKENLIYQQIIDSETEDSFKLPIDEAFLGLRESSNLLSREFENYVEHTFDQQRQLSKSLEQRLLIKGLLLLALSCALILVLLTTLSGSLRQLDQAIRRLASAELKESIKVQGPADLRCLGERLEWLRTHLIALQSSKQQLLHNLAREIEQALQTDGLLPTDADQAGSNSGLKSAHPIQINIDKLKIVSGQLLKYSQLPADSSLYQNQVFDLKALLESVIEGFQQDLQAKSIRIKKQFSPIEIDAVLQHMRALFEHLLSHAIRYSPIDGEIRITLRDIGDHMELEIEDDGPTLTTEQRTQMFEPFYRRNTANNQSPNDNPSLELAMVREYVTLQQGIVDFIEPRQGYTGARVRVRIPLEIET